MALDALLASLEADAARTAEAIVADARTDAAARVADAEAARARRLAAAVTERRAALEARLETALAAARQEAERDVLAARDEVLGRIRERARRHLASATDEPARATVATLVRAAASYLGADGGQVRCAPVFRAALEPVASEAGLTLALDDAMRAGARVASADGRVVLDATLPSLLDRRWDDEAIRLAPRLEAGG